MYQLALHTFDESGSFVQGIADLVVMTAMVDDLPDLRCHDLTHLLLWQLLNGNEKIIGVEVRDFLEPAYLEEIATHSRTYFIRAELRLPVQLFLYLSPFLGQLL